MAVTNVKGRQLDIADVASELVNDAPALAILTGDLATAAQGVLADSAVQPGDDVSDLANDAFYQGRVVPGTTGDFAALDANGDIIDGGSQASDFATAAQGATADSALQNTTDTFTGVLTLTGTLDVSGGVDKLQSATTAIDVAAATAPTVGQILTAVSSTVANWQDAPTPIDAYLKLESDAAAGNAGAKINKVASSVADNVPVLLADGQLEDSSTTAPTLTSADGSDVTITTGDSAAGNAGTVYITSGINGSGAFTATGDIDIRTPHAIDNGGTNNNGGDLILRTGNGIGTGLPGTISILGGSGADSAGSDVTVRAGGASSGNNPGGTLELSALAGAGTGNGGAIDILSGDSGGGATGDGGVINITAGDAVGTIGTGGVINITGGISKETGGSTATGGDINITGGALTGTGSSNAGDVAIRGGENLNTSVGNAGAVSMIGGNNSAGTNSAGSASVFGGAGTGSANGGSSTLRGGAGGVTGLGGDARVIGGAGGATSGDAGDIVLTPGAAAGSGSAGAIVVTQSAAPSVTTDKLYNVAGTLIWNGTDITASGIADVVDDTTPQLGGNLDVNGFDIITADAATPENIDLLAGSASGAGQGGDINLTGGVGGATSGQGGNISLAGGQGGTGGIGGAVSIDGGDSGDAAAQAGSVIIRGGTGGTQGGAVTLTAGDGGTIDDTGTGGSLTFNAGDGGSTSGNGGGIAFNPGTGGSNPGDVTFNAAVNGGTNRKGGEFVVTAGDGTGTANGGDVALTAGEAGATGDGGSIILTPGGNTAGTDGAVQISTGSFIKEFTVSTTDATVTEIASLPVGSDEVLVATIRAHGYEAATGDTISEVIHATVKNDSGTTSLVGTATVAHTAEDAGAAAWAFTVAADDGADALTLDVTGEAAHSIDWMCTIEWTRG